MIVNLYHDYKIEVEIIFFDCEISYKWIKKGITLKWITKTKEGNAEEVQNIIDDLGSRWI